jgi:hypothetical protein
MRKKWFVLLAMLLPFVPLPARAQIAWETPMLMSPNPPSGLGLYLMDAAGGDIGLMMSWRGTGSSWGLRGGIAEAQDDDFGVFGGLDFSGDVHHETQSFPLDVDWFTGIGVGASDAGLLTVPLGLTFGHTFSENNAVFLPYIAPRIFLDAFFGDDRDDEVDLGLAIDLGVDLRLSRSANAPVIRFGASLGDHEGFALGVVF